MRSGRFVSSGRPGFMREAKSVRSARRRERERERERERDFKFDFQARAAMNRKFSESVSELVFAFLSFFDGVSSEGCEVTRSSLWW